jgi:hydroxypyruvate reductase
LRQSAREILSAALRAVDACEVTKRVITIDGAFIRIKETLLDANQPIYAVCIGKAANSMAGALNEMIGYRIMRGIISCKGQAAEGLPGTWQRFHGGHPLPNADSLAAAQATFELLETANDEHANVIFAVSGGGSAMIEWPVNKEISLSDLQETNRLLVSCGATIAEVNTVRRAFSAVKGGKLIARAPDANLLTLIVSDVNRGDEANVASGPTLFPLPNKLTATEVVEHYQLASRLPETILLAIRQSSDPFPAAGSGCAHYVLADNMTAIEAAAARAEELGFTAVVSEEISEQPISDGCKQLVELLKSQLAPVCLVSGGEFSCPVRGDGLGGRNTETALRSAIALDAEQDDTVVLSAGTDGIDGNSPAAGAIADNTSLSRARAMGLDPEESLAKSDSYGFFERLGDAIFTGPTGTNVRDVRILLKS